MKHWIMFWAWHGLRGAILGGAAAVTIAVKNGTWPTPVDWLIIGIGAAVGFVNGADSYRQEPK